MAGNPREGAQGSAVGASVGVTILVLLIVSLDHQVGIAFSMFLPALREQGWELMDIARLSALGLFVRWGVVILAAVLATFVAARGYMGWFGFIMSARGRASRRRYWLSCWLPLLIASLVPLVLGAAATYVAMLSIGTQPTEAAVTSLATSYGHAIIIDLLLLWPSFAAVVKRLHDRGKSGWFILVGLIPLIGQIWLLLEVGFLPGQRGDNRYGADPLAPASPID
jgi:uncharacterized membrane protein YhaH (DUF805 family)